MEKGNAFLDFVTKIVAILLPVSQFFVQYLPASLSSVFLAGSPAFVFVSVIVLLACASSWLILTAYTYFELPFNISKHRKYMKAQQELEEENRPGIGSAPAPTPDVAKPFYLTPNNLQVIALLVATAAGLVFVITGTIADKSNTSAVVIQLVTYVLAVVGYFLVLIIFSERRKSVDSFNKVEASRFQIAISRAIEGQAFSEFPVVSYKGMLRTGNTGSSEAAFTIHVSVRTDTESKDYRIGTDYSGQIIYWVLPESLFD